LAVNNDGANQMELPSDKLAFHIEEAREAGAGSRSEIYEALRRGDLKAKKRGRRTVILRDDLATYLASLPDYEPQAGAC
jgi:hypothetical protein